MNHNVNDMFCGAQQTCFWIQLLSDRFSSSSLLSPRSNVRHDKFFPTSLGRFVRVLDVMDMDTGELITLARRVNVTIASINQDAT